MALTKRVYTDGETIITAQNLNDIQDEIISQGNTLVPKTRTINSKALSSNITLTAADVSAVPTTRTVNSKALSSNITLTSGDIEYNSSTTYTSGSVGAAVSDLNGALTPLKTAPALTSSNNLNDLYGSDKNGFYYLGSGVQNAPTNYAGLVNITNANGECFQFVVGAYNVISFRYRAGNPASWSTWREMYSPESVTLTPSSTYINSTSGVVCQKIGRIVMFAGTLVMKATATTGNVMMTGFPVPSSNVMIFGNVIEDPNNTANRGKNGRFMINTSGQLVPWYNTWGASDNGATLLFNVVYFI